VDNISLNGQQNDGNTCNITHGFISCSNYKKMNILLTVVQNPEAMQTHCMGQSGIFSVDFYHHACTPAHFIRYQSNNIHI